MKPIVDAHFHIWRQADLPWLSGPMQPRIFGPYEPIRRDYTIEEYLDDASAGAIAKSVYVQTNWPADRFEDEVAWVQQVADRHGSPHAVVGYADFLADDVRPQLDRLIRYRLLRGVRMQLHWHSYPLFRFASSPDLMNDPRFRRNMAHLADYDLPFELQLFSGQMHMGARLIADNPRTTFVVIHGGMLEDASDEAIAAWQTGMARLAAQPNCRVKLSGLGTFIHAVDEAQIAFIISDLIAVFGADRCLFGSNFPIEKLWTSYGALIAAYQRATASLSETEKDAIFHDTATRTYRL